MFNSSTTLPLGNRENFYSVNLTLSSAFLLHGLDARKARVPLFLLFLFAVIKYEAARKEAKDV